MPNLPQVAITDFQNIHEHRYLPAGEERPIGRRYCGATVVLSDGDSRDIWYLIEEGQGFAVDRQQCRVLRVRLRPLVRLQRPLPRPALIRHRCGAWLGSPPRLLAAGCSQEAAEAPASAPNTSIVQTVPAAPPTSNVPEGKGFDFYVLSLSWSPSYCEAEGEDANRQQCAAGRPYAFVVHGLWPQFERGFPENCPTDEPDVSQRHASRALRPHAVGRPDPLSVAQARVVLGARRRRDYFDVLRAARETVSIPQEFRRLDELQDARSRRCRSGLPQGQSSRCRRTAIAVTCDKRYLREVRICMTKDLKFRSCPEIDRRDCRLGKVVMPPVRGG